MKKLILTGIWILALAKYAGAQEQLTIKQQADRLFDRYEYFKSIGLYLKLIKKQKNDAGLSERIADCYRNINRYHDAETWYARVAMDAKASRISHYYYAEVLLRDEKFDLAKQQYKLFYADDPQALKLKLAVCDSAALWMAHPAAYKVENDSSLNSHYSDWGLSFEGSGQVVFTSDRKTEAADIDDRTGNNWFKSYESDIKGGDVKEFVINAGKNSVFKDSYHVGPIGFNKAGDTAYITVTTAVARKNLEIDKAEAKSTQRLYSRRLQLVMAGKTDGRWAVFGSFPYNNIQKYSLGDAALSPNGRIIYFSSDMPGGEGKTDIWYCEKRADGSWGSPVNCGKTINTKEEEAFPVIGGDGALYYSSKGLPGMGGYDIFRATGEKAHWDTPKNMKYPINSTSDDFYLVTQGGAEGYFSSNREGGRGSDDIYSFSIKPADTIPSKQITHHDTTGRKPVGPTKFAPGLVLTTIYYDLDKSNIRPDAAAELDKLVILLKQRPALKIELSSYTDSRASDSYNMALSQRRAASAFAYLVNKGIDASRLLAKYYGETQPVNKCADNVQCTEAEHQLNRRTEFRVGDF